MSSRTRSPAIVLASAAAGLLFWLGPPEYSGHVAVGQHPPTKSQHPAADRKQAERLDLLIRQAQSDDKKARREAISAIGAMGRAALTAVPALIELLDADWEQRSEVRHALLAIGTKEVLPALTRALKHTSSNVRMGAAMTLGGMGRVAKPAISDLVALLSDPDWEVRLDACIALESVGDPEPVDQLLRVMKADKEVRVRGAAGTVAARLLADSPKARPVVLAAIESMKGGMIWLEDAKAMFALAGKPAIPEMLTLLEDPKTAKPHREIVFQVLWHLNKEKYGGKDLRRLVKLIDHATKDVRQGALLILERKAVGDAETARRVERALKDQEPLVRVQAALCLYVITRCVNPAMGVLITEMTSAEAEVREAACRAVYEFGADGALAVPGLIARLKDANHDVRFQALRALREIGPGAKDAESELKKLTGDPDLGRLAEAALKEIRRQP